MMWWSERGRIFLWCLDLFSSHQITTFLMPNLRKLWRKSSIKNEQEVLKFMKILTLGARIMWSRIMMIIDINLIKMMRIQEMMIWTFLQMLEKLKNLQQIKAMLVDQILKRLLQKLLKKSILMNLKQKHLTTYLEFNSKVTIILRMTNLYFLYELLHLSSSIHMIFLLKATFITMNRRYQNLMVIKFRA